MNADVTALILGTLLAVGALAYVLYPLFFSSRAAARPSSAPAVRMDDSAIVALREIEFDRATGKLSEPDYLGLKQAYSARALEELRATEGAPPSPATTSPPADSIEARVRAYRMARKECDTCGLRPEPDAVYCSACGSYLGGVCPKCASAIVETSAAFCSTCGVTLAASRRPAGAF